MDFQQSKMKIEGTEGDIRDISFLTLCIVFVSYKNLIIITIKISL
jgi:hypothetical protein